MVKPAKGPEKKIDGKPSKDDDVQILKDNTGDPDVSASDLGDKKPSPISGHSDDPDFYVDQNGLTRWRVLGAEGDVITSATKGFASEADAKKDFDEARKDGRLLDIREFQGKSGRGFTSTESVQSA